MIRGTETLEEIARREFSEEVVRLERTTAQNAGTFFGNLGEHLGFLENRTPEEIAYLVRECFKSNIRVFRTDPSSRYSIVSPEGSLAPIDGASETYKVTFEHLSALYLAARTPIALEQLKLLLAPLYTGWRLYRDNDPAFKSLAD